MPSKPRPLTPLDVPIPFYAAVSLRLQKLKEMEVDMRGAENDEPEMLFRRGYQQDARSSAELAVKHVSWFCAVAPHPAGLA